MGRSSRDTSWGDPFEGREQEWVGAVPRRELRDGEWPGDLKPRVGRTEATFFVRGIVDIMQIEELRVGLEHLEAMGEPGRKEERAAIIGP